MNVSCEFVYDYIKGSVEQLVSRSDNTIFNLACFPEGFSAQEKFDFIQGFFMSCFNSISREILEDDDLIILGLEVSEEFMREEDEKELFRNLRREMQTPAIQSRKKNNFSFEQQANFAVHAILLSADESLRNQCRLSEEHYELVRNNSALAQGRTEMCVFAVTTIDFVGRFLQKPVLSQLYGIARLL